MKKMSHTNLYAEIRKLQISQKENSVHTHLLFELLSPVEPAATESMISKDKIMKNARRF